MTFGDVAGGFASADRVIRRRLRWHRASAQPLETAGAVCRFNPASGRMDVWSNTNMINYVGWLVANTLKVRAEQAEHQSHGRGRQLRLQARAGQGHRHRRDAGQAHGPRREVHGGPRRQPHRLREPRVRPLLRRRACGYCRRHLHGLRIKVVDDYGAYFQFGHGTHGNALAQATGPYRIRGFEYTRAVRADQQVPAGRLPRRRLGREQLRSRAPGRRGRAGAGHGPRGDPPAQLHPPDAFPFKMPAGNIYDSGDYPEVLDQALEMAG